MPRRILIHLTMMMAACLTVFSWYATAADTAPKDPATLEVIGRAAILVEPDIALVSFTVETNARQATEAVNDNAQQTEALLKALRSIMGSEDKLQTDGFNLQPVYDKDDHLRPSGYRVNNRVTLETIQLNMVGNFIDQAAASGAGKIGSLQFQSRREADHRSDASVMAVAQARANAQKLAQAAGVTLGRVLRIHYAPQGRPGVYYEKATMAMSRSPIAVGDMTVEAEVTIIFEIE